MFRNRQVTSTLLHVEFVNEGQEDRDVVFSIMRNTKSLPVNFSCLYQTKFSDNIYFGLRFLDIINKAECYTPDFFAKNGFHLFTEKLKQFEFKGWEKELNAFLRVHKRSAKELREIDILNGILSKRQLNYPLTPYRQLAIMDALNASPLFKTQKEWTSLLRYTNYDWKRVEAELDPSLAGTVQLFRRKQEDLIDFYKEWEMRIVEAIISRLFIPMDEYKKKSLATRRNEYHSSELTEKPEFRYYFDRLYGSLDNYLSPDTERNPFEISKDVCFGLNEISGGAYHQNESV